MNLSIDRAANIEKQLNSIQDKLIVLESKIERIASTSSKDKDYYTKEDIAEWLKITVRTLSNYYNDNKVKLPKRSFYSKKNYIVTKQDFQDWYASLQE